MNHPLQFSPFKTHILYYLLSIIFYLYYLLLVLAVVAGLGADVNIIAGQMGAHDAFWALFCC